MQPCYEFRIIRYEPDARRGERVNIGLLVMVGEKAEVHLLKNMSKALALSPQVGFSVSLQADLADMFTDLAKDSGLEKVESIGEFSLSAAGAFFCEKNRLPMEIEAAMNRLVNPARRPSAHEGTTRLHTEIKRQFKSDKVLATDPSQITDHKVVAGWGFPGDEELSADFAYKNGAWNIMQVLDYRASTPVAAAKKIKEVSLKAIAMDQAKKDPERLLGENLEVKTHTVVWVPQELEDTVGPQVDILEGYSTIYRFQNQREQVKFWDMMSKLTKGHAHA